MQDIRLFKHQDRWLALVTLDDNKAAPMTLRAPLEDAEAHRLNHLPWAERKQALLPQIHTSACVDDDELPHHVLMQMRPHTAKQPVSEAGRSKRHG